MRTVISLALLLSLMGMSLPGIASEATADAPLTIETDSAEHGASDASHAGEHHGLTPHAPDLFNIGPLPVSNSMVVTWVVALGLIVMAQLSTRRMQAVPSGIQNFFEWMIESLYSFLEGVVGSELAKKTFWFFATIFLFILFANWFGLIPGVGTIGKGYVTDHGFQVVHPLLRGANADLNMTFGMASIFFVLWFIWALQANGVKGFILHIFGPKGDTTGFMKVLMIGIFMIVGVLELVSILFRPVSLSFRLYGNIFAGENMLESMAVLVPWLGWLIPIPFYFLELLVGLVQALVFMLLTAVFTLLICSHDEEHEAAAH